MKEKTTRLSIRINKRILSAFGIMVGGISWGAIYFFIAFSNPELTSTQVLIIMIDFFFE